LLQDMLEYSLLPDVEDYENAVEIRDYIKEIKEGL
jgi:protein-arginine kinase activator protein McsA